MTKQVYKYGFQGMQRTDEWSGSGNHYSTYYRGYDPRLGRWISHEPKYVAWESPYNAFRNNPIYLTDPMGDWPKVGKFLKRISPWHIGGLRRPFSFKNIVLPKINLGKWKGLANYFRSLNIGPPAGRMVNQGWSYGNDDRNWSSMSIATNGNPIDRTSSVNLFREMASKANDSRVSMTGIEIHGEAPPGTVFSVTGGKSQGHQRSLFASNGLQNMGSPSHLRLLFSDDDGKSPVPNNYFEARAGYIPGSNLMPSFSLFNPSPGSRFGLAAWMLNAFNHKPLLTNQVWGLRFRAYNINGYHGHVNFRYRYRWKAWEEWQVGEKSFLLRSWHKLLWGTAGVD